MAPRVSGKPPSCSDCRKVAFLRIAAGGSPCRSTPPTPPFSTTRTRPSRPCGRSPPCTSTRCWACPSPCRTRPARRCCAAAPWAGSGPTRSPPREFPAFNLLHRNSLLEREGEPHDRLRTLVAGAFNRGHTARLEPAVQRARRPARRRARRPGPAHRLGRPHGRRRARAAGRGDRRAARAAGRRCGRGSAAGRPRSSRCTSPTRTADGGARAETASAEFVDALREVIAHRREHPGRRPGERPGRGRPRRRAGGGARLGTDELVGTAALLLMAGHEATVNVIGNGVLALLAPPRAVAAAGGRPGARPPRPSRSSSASTRRCSCSSAPPCATRPSPGTTSPRARRSPPCSAPRRTTRRSSTIPPSWTSGGGATRTSGSARGCTTAWARRSRGWRWRRCWMRCAAACRGWCSRRRPGDGRTSSCGGCGSCGWRRDRLPAASRPGVADGEQQPPAGRTDRVQQHRQPAHEHRGDACRDRGEQVQHARAARPRPPGPARRCATTRPARSPSARPPATHSTHHTPTSRDGCGRRSGARSSAPCSISASTEPGTARFHPGTTHPSTISRHDRDGSEPLRAAAAAAAAARDQTTTTAARREAEQHRPRAGGEHQRVRRRHGVRRQRTLPAGQQQHVAPRLGAGREQRDGRQRPQQRAPRPRRASGPAARGGAGRAGRRARSQPAVHGAAGKPQRCGSA